MNLSVCGAGGWQGRGVAHVGHAGGSHGGRGGRVFCDGVPVRWGDRDHRPQHQTGQHLPGGGGGARCPGVGRGLG